MVNVTVRTTGTGDKIGSGAGTVPRGGATQIEVATDH